MYGRLAILALLSLGLVACGARDVQTDPLAGSEWRLVGIDYPDGPEPAVGAAAIEFTADGGVGGWTGCNGFAGQYRLQGSELRFEGVKMSARGCPSGAVVRQEDRVRDLLSREPRFEITGEPPVLRIYHGQGQFKFERHAGPAADQRPERGPGRAAATGSQAREQRLP